MDPLPPYLRRYDWILLAPNYMYPSSPYLRFGVWIHRDSGFKAIKDKHKPQDVAKKCGST